MAFYKKIVLKQLNENSSFFIWQLKEKISLVSVHVDSFHTVSNIRTRLDAIKIFFSREYYIKNLEGIKTVIE